MSLQYSNSGKLWDSDKHFERVFSLRAAFSWSCTWLSHCVSSVAQVHLQTLLPTPPTPHTRAEWETRIPLGTFIPKVTGISGDCSPYLLKMRTDLELEGRKTGIAASSKHLLYTNLSGSWYYSKRFSDAEGVSAIWWKQSSSPMLSNV